MYKRIHIFLIDPLWYIKLLLNHVSDGDVSSTEGGVAGPTLLLFNLEFLFLLDWFTNLKG